MNEPEETVRRVLEVAKTGDVVLTLGAGNVWTLGEKIVGDLL
jgi:UDP-N-acetylmuramate-alanine ligase